MRFDYELNRVALLKACGVGIGLTLAANAGGFVIYASYGLLGGSLTFSPALLAASLGMNVFLLVLYLAYGAAYATFAGQPLSWQSGAVGGGLTGLITSGATLTLAMMLLAALLGGQAPAVIADGLAELGVNWGMPPLASALTAVGSVYLLAMGFATLMSGVSGALYAVTNGPDGFYSDYEIPEW